MIQRFVVVSVAVGVALGGCQKSQPWVESRQVVSPCFDAGHGLAGIFMNGMSATDKQPWIAKAKEAQSICHAATPKLAALGAPAACTTLTEGFAQGGGAVIDKLSGGNPGPVNTLSAEKLRCLVWLKDGSIL